MRLISGAADRHFAVDPGRLLARKQTAGHDRVVEYVPYQRRHLDGVVALCDAEGWPSFAEDLNRANRVLTAPGVATVVALDGDAVVGFASLQSDGEIQAHLSTIAVDRTRRRSGIARRLLQEALDRTGAQRVDLITDSAESFYEALRHKRWSGFRIYPPFV